MEYNTYNQPIGDAVPSFKSPEKLDIEILEGKYSKLEHLNMHHLDDLFEVLCVPDNDPNWTYLPNEPIHNKEAFCTLIQNYCHSEDPYFFAIVDKTNDKALGLMSLLRINTKASSIEVGHIHYSPLLKRTRIATEVQYLIAKYVFETLGYRRYE